jgi:endoglucanase
MTESLKTLCGIPGISGAEDAVRDAVVSLLPSGVGHRTDPLGSLIVHKPGLPAKNRLMLSAHMDEVGLLVTHVTEEGLLRFSPIGIDPRVLHGRRVLVGGKVPGVIGAKAGHHLTDEEKDAPLKAEHLYIDIGALTRQEAALLASPGDWAAFSAEIEPFGDGMLLSKALDDRAGCALLLNLLRHSSESFDAVFTVQEESGLAGAAAAGYAVDAAIALILETTTAADIAGVPAEKQVCRLGAGPVVSFADKGALYDRELFALALSTARELEIPAQVKEGVVGGNEARAVQRAGPGRRVLAVSLPCRYLHSDSSVLAVCDLEHTAKLLLALLPRLAAL